MFRNYSFECTMLFIFKNYCVGYWIIWKIMLFEPLWMQWIILALLLLNWQTCLSNKCSTYQSWRLGFHLWARCLFVGETVIISDSFNCLLRVYWSRCLCSDHRLAKFMWIKKVVASTKCPSELQGIISITLCQVCFREAMFSCWVLSSENQRYRPCNFHL